MFAEECDPNQVYRAACPSSRSLNIEYDVARAGNRTCHRLNQQWRTGATLADIAPRYGGHARAHSARSLRANSERETPLAYSMWRQTSRLAAMLLRDGRDSDALELRARHRRFVRRLLPEVGRFLARPALVD